MNVMKADLIKINDLLASDISGWQIEKDTGISRTAIAEMRRGNRKAENLRLGTAITLTNFYDQWRD